MTDQWSPKSDRLLEALRRFVAVPFRRQTYRNLTYLALSFPLRVAYFVGATIGLSTGAGLLTRWKFCYPSGA